MSDADEPRYGGRPLAHLLASLEVITHWPGMTVDGVDTNAKRELLLAVKVLMAQAAVVESARDELNAYGPGEMELGEVLEFPDGLYGRMQVALAELDALGGA